MYYVNFDENGNQSELKWFDGVEPSEDGWYQAEIDIVGKRYRLVSNEVIEMTNEEIQFENDQLFLASSLVGIKEQRNRMLLESDWTVNPQIAMSDEKKAEWTSYRQSLRDLPSTITLDFLKSGADLSWPVPPS
jgi:hypothetical protein